MLKFNSTWILIVGTLRAILLGFLLTIVLRHLIGFPATFTAQVLLMAVFAAVYGYWGFGTVPPANRGVVLFGGKRLASGSDGYGLEEGPYLLAFGKPIYKVENKPIAEMRVDFIDEEAWTSDRVPAIVVGFLQIEILKPSVYYYGVEDAKGSLMKLTLEANRNISRGMDAETLVLANNEELGNKVEAELRRLLALQGNGDGIRWGIRFKDLEIEKTSVPKEVADAWKQKPIQIALGIAEGIEAKRRTEQADDFKKTGADANTALAAALVNANKPGAKVTNINFDGLKGVGAGIEKVGDSIHAIAEALTGKDT